MGAARIVEASRFVDVWMYAGGKSVTWVKTGYAATFRRLLKCWRERMRQRYELSELDPRMLRDIGITEEQAGREVLKLFWQE